MKYDLDKVSADKGNSAVTLKSSFFVMSSQAYEKGFEHWEIIWIYVQTDSKIILFILFVLANYKKNTWTKIYTEKIRDCQWLILLDFFV